MCPEPVLNCSAPLRADRAQNPPTSSSLANKEARRLAPHKLLASLAEAGAAEPLPSSLAADGRRVCPLDRPGQRRASLAQHGGARSGLRLTPLAKEQ
jgi:hypothetical protein